ncbi:MAG: MFS transporter [Alphaproteobacteria bacterium]|nr:MAG: MFS transporter [Alphaproteobacteria bacterium]
MSLKNMPKGVIALGFVSLFMDVSSEMIHSLLPLFMLKTLGVTALTVGIIEGIAESTAAIVKIFSGAISDWIGKRKPLLLLGYGLSTLTKPLFPVADSVATVLFARFADRVGKGIRVAPRDAFVADVTPEKQRGAAYGLRQTMDTVGAFTGPALAIVIMLATAGSFKTVFAIAIIPAVIVMLIILFAIKEPARHHADKKPFPLKPAQLKLLPAAFWWISIFSAALTLARFSEAFLILRGDTVNLDPAYAPAILIVMNIVYAAASWPAGILSDKIGKRGLLVAGIATLIAADIVLAMTGNLYMLFFGCALWGLHMGLTQGILTAFIADQAPAHLRGTAFGMYNLLSGVALLLASIIAGWLWKTHGPGATFEASALLSAASLAGFLVLQPRLRSKTA